MATSVLLDLKLQVRLCPHYNVLAKAICPRLFVVYKYVLLFITVVVECIFMPSFIFISVSIGQCINMRFINCLTLLVVYKHVVLFTSWFSLCSKFHCPEFYHDRFTSIFVSPL